MVSSRYVVGLARELADGEHMIVVVNNRSIGIYNLKGKFYGLLNHCPHRGAELCKGRLQSDIVSPRPGEYSYDATERMLVCPWHGWEFDIPTGQSYFDPKGVRARPFEIDVENGQAVITEVAAGQTSLTPDEYAAVAVDAQPDATGRVPGPYQAETIQISVEDDYLVVNMRPKRPPRPARPAAPAHSTRPLPALAEETA